MSTVCKQGLLVAEIVQPHHHSESPHAGCVFGIAYIHTHYHPNKSSTHSDLFSRPFRQPLSLSKPRQTSQALPFTQTHVVVTICALGMSTAQWCCRHVGARESARDNTCLPLRENPRENPGYSPFLLYHVTMNITISPKLQSALLKG